MDNRLVMVAPRRKRLPVTVRKFRAGFADSGARGSRGRVERRQPQGRREE
jgi:hypothetical protein